GLILRDDLQVVLAADAVGRLRPYLVHMSRYIDWGRLHAPDLAIAALTVGTILELVFTSVDYNEAIIPFSVLAAPVLFFRHRFPLGAPTATFALIAGFAAVSNQAGNDLSFPFFCGLAAMAIFGASEERRVAYAGIPIALATIAWVMGRFHQSAADLPWVGGFFIAAWLAGFILNSRSRQTAELRGRAARLERDREAKGREAPADEPARNPRDGPQLQGHDRPGSRGAAPTRGSPGARARGIAGRGANGPRSTRRDAQARRRAAAPRGGAGARAAAEPQAPRKAGRASARVRPRRRP